MHNITIDYPINICSYIEFVVENCNRICNTTFTINYIYII